MTLSADDENEKEKGEGREEERLLEEDANLGEDESGQMSFL